MLTHLPRPPAVGPYGVVPRARERGSQEFVLGTCKHDSEANPNKASVYGRDGFVTGTGNDFRKAC